MTLKAEVYQLGRTRRWRWTVYDTDLPLRSLDNGSAEAHEWATALLDAESALQRLHLRAFQDRVNETVTALAYGTPVLRFVAGLPPEPTCYTCGLMFLAHDNNDCMGDWSTAPPALVWEGDYA